MKWSWTWQDLLGESSRWLKFETVEFDKGWVSNGQDNRGLES